jgi:thiamine-monophosphate kinase
MSTRRSVSLPDINLSELSLLSQIRSRAARLSTSALKLSIGDDCALLRLGSGEELAVTTDLSIAGRHFQLDWHPPESVGHRTLARGLSDLAAMGARPVAAFLSLGLPGELTKSRARQHSWITRFYDGLLALSEIQKTPLAGGDLAESPVAVADIVLVGAVPRGKALLRSGARPGHLLYVTGNLGGSAAGLAQLANLAAASAPPSPSPLNISANLATQLASHLYPQPRISQGLWLRQRGLATAAIDLSDGLSTDLAHLCTESSVTAAIDAARLPIHPGATLEQALHGGEDYELLFAAPPSARIPLSIAGVSITRIGRILSPRRGRPLVTLVTAQGKHPLEARGWEHFS